MPATLKLGRPPAKEPKKVIPLCDILRANRLAEENDRLAHWAVNRFLRWTPSHQDYQDAVQEARISLRKSCLLFDPERKVKLSAFAGTNMMRHLLHWRDRQSRNGFRCADGPVFTGELTVSADVGKAEVDTVELDDEAARVRAAMLKLEPRSALAITLRYACGWKLVEIGWRLNVGKEMARLIIRDGLDALRNSMTPEE